MPRARNIKPAFFKNEVLAELKPHVRLLFIGLWTLADREGRLEDRPTRIRAEIFPYETVNINEGLELLNSAGFIQRYSVESSKYIQITNFEKHQNPHVKEQASTIPAPCKHHASTEVAALIPDSLSSDSPSLDSPAPPDFDSNRNFEVIWSKYPKRDGKKQALAHFRASVKNLEGMERIERALTNYLASQRVRDGFIKNGSTWFNNWQDWENYVEDGQKVADPMAWTRLLKKKEPK